MRRQDHVGIRLGCGVCDFLYSEPPTLASVLVVKRGGKGKLLPERVFSPEWLFGAVTVTLTCGTYG